MDPTQLVKGVLDLAVLAAIAREDGSRPVHPSQDLVRLRGDDGRAARRSRSTRMTETTAVMTTGPGADVRAYVAQVREQLADLPSEDVDDLTLGMEADLMELASAAGPDLRSPWDPAGVCRGVALRCWPPGALGSGSPECPAEPEGAGRSTRRSDLDRCPLASGAARRLVVGAGRHRGHVRGLVVLLVAASHPRARGRPRCRLDLAWPAHACWTDTLVAAPHPQPARRPHRALLVRKPALTTSGERVG